MGDWQELIEQVLRDLGGEKVCVPGAKLHTEVSRRAYKEGRDFGTYLAENNQRFAEFLETNDRIRLHRRRGADVLVGFDGAILPAQGPPAEYPVFRDDVYKAFTRITSMPYVYSRSADAFITDPGSATDVVEVPPVTLEQLLQQRREFAQSITDAQAAQRLMDAIERSPNPLATFQRSLGELGLLRRWHESNYAAIRERVNAWAQENSVEVSDAWFAQRAQPAESPQEILAELSRHLTDEEVRQMAIPFRAVEEFYRALPRKRHT